MSGFMISKSIGVVNVYRKSIVVATIVAIVMVIPVASGKEPVLGSNDTLEVEALSKKIKDLVKGLEYSDKLAEDFVQMVMSWKDAQGEPVLVLWKQRLNQARHDYKRDNISKDQIAKVEEIIVRELTHRIQKEISLDPNEKFFDLADVIKHEKANCLGHSQLVYILGNSVGVSIETIGVLELATGVLSQGHMTCIASLTDGRTIMVDLDRMPTPMISKPFELKEEFTKAGNYWELIDKGNPLGIHIRIEILNRNTIIAAIYKNRAIDYRMLGQYAEAISHCNKAIELDPKYHEAYVARGNVYVDLGQHTKAISDYNKAIELNPKFAGAYSNRGVAYRRLGQLNQAISDCNKAIELNPKFAEAYCNRGTAYADLGQHTKAISDYTKAIELNAKDAAAYNNRGNGYADLGQYTTAISDYTKAIELNAKYAEAYNNRATAYFELRQHTKALSDLNKAIELNLKDDEVYCNRGVVYAFLGKFEQAKEDLLKAVELNPSLKPFVRKISEHFKLNLGLD